MRLVHLVVSPSRQELLHHAVSRSAVTEVSHHAHVTVPQKWWERPMCVSGRCRWSGPWSQSRFCGSSPLIFCAWLLPIPQRPLSTDSEASILCSFQETPRQHSASAAQVPITGRPARALDLQGTKHCNRRRRSAVSGLRLTPGRRRRPSAAALHRRRLKCQRYTKAQHAAAATVTPAGRLGRCASDSEP